MKDVIYKKLIESNPGLFSNKNALFRIILDEQIIDDWEVKRKEELQKENLPIKWGNIGVVYNDPYILILRDLVEFPDGTLGSYFRLINFADINNGHAVAIFPVINKKVVLLNQFRHATRKWHLEIPRGFGEPHLTAIKNAKKELREEINGEIVHIKKLGPYHNNTGIEGVTVNLFYADLKMIGDVNLQEGIKSYELFTIDELEELIRKSKITDGFTIAAYTRAKLNKLI